ncbi:hypothetical protein B5M44_11620 [Shinella sumterensis]|jgi:hypothetical protein|uniref:hypothetical protein n=1 Tax=Shinella sumterensis TaxID=1967501 RepID=UPI00106E1710|nr:hypothetical protein [Shinella sumterensis]MCD1265534.1 hypothetical protein [Shinella sumterensis]TFE98258.1 hypothetical protein B5M44_11620 [Shinella sumterensis]
MVEFMIDLSKFTGDRKVRNLSGKERGMAAREDLKLDQLDLTDGQVEVIIPEYLDTISPSFFQGLFSQSIAKLQGREGFLRKYQFRASEQLMQWVNIGIRNATSDRGKLI